MPPSRTPAPGGEGPLLESWRKPQLSDARARAWLILRRATISAILLGLVGWLAYLLLSPTLLPRTFFAFIAADGVQKAAAPPVDFVYEDLLGYADLSDALRPVVSGTTPVQWVRCEGPRSIRNWLDDLASSRLTERDALIVAVTAHGVVRDGKPCLIGNEFHPTESGDAVYPVGDLIEALDGLPGKTKLLVLDATRHDYDPRLGMTVNGFAEKLEQEVLRLGKPSVWVLSSSSPGERSHVSRALRRSVFSYVVSGGLAGAADLDGDNSVELDELQRFVRLNVSRWVDKLTASNESQTPMLLHPRAEDVGKSPPHLLFTHRLSTGIEKYGRGFFSAFATTVAFSAERIREFGIDPATELADQGEALLTGGDDSDDRESAEGGDQAESSTSRGARRQTVVQDLQEAWRLSAGVDSRPIAPAEYAPSLWRRHLEEMLWLERRLQAGMMTSSMYSEIAREVTGLKQSLQAFDKPFVPSGRAPNAVDQIRLQRPTSPIALRDAPTLAIAEAIAEDDPTQALPDALSKFVARYDSWLNSDQGFAEGFDPILLKWSEETWEGATWSESHEKYYELELIEELRGARGLADADAKLALRSRRLSEQAAAPLAWGQGWMAEETADADRLRLEAERLMTSQATSDWRARAVQNLQEANGLYRRAIAELKTVRRARREHSQVLARARDYLRYYRRSPRGRAGASRPLEDLFATLTRLARGLESPAGSGAEAIEGDLLSLRKARDQLQSAFETGNNSSGQPDLTGSDAAWRAERLMRTSLLPPALRPMVAAGRARAEQRILRDFTLEAPTSDKRLPAPVPRDARKLLRLEWALLDSHGRKGGEGAAVAKLDDAKLHEHSRRLAGAVAGMPREVRRLIDDNSNLSNRRKRPERLAKLRDAARLLHLVHRADSAASGVGSAQEGSQAILTRSLRNAAWYDLLTSLADRRHEALRDARAAEAGQLVDYRQRLIDLAGQLAERSSQPPPPIHDPPLLRIRALDTPSLVKEDSATMKLEVEWLGGEETPIWIVAQHDGRLINVEGDGFALLDENDLRDELFDAGPSVDRRYPYHPARVKRIEAMKLGAGSRRLPVRVSRSERAGANTTVVFRAIGPIDSKEYARCEVGVEMPGLETLQLSVVDRREERPVTNEPILLFPNHQRDLTLRVRNQGGSAQTLTATLLALRKPPRELTLPPGAVSAEFASQLLEDLGDSAPVAVGAELKELQPGEQRTIEFDFGASENLRLLGSEPPSDDEPVSIPLRDLLLVLTDEATGEQTLRRLRFEVMRPNKYVRARANFNPRQNQPMLTVTLTADRSTAPARIDAKLVIDRRFVFRGTKSSGVIRQAGGECEMQVTLNPDADWPASDLPVYVTVDDYPRAFRFTIPRGAPPGRLEEDRESASLRIISPREGQSFLSSSTYRLRVEAEVDAPEGFFRGRGNSVKLGIDEGSERELADDDPLVLESDRWVEIMARLPSQRRSTLALASSVGDLRLDLDVGQREGEVLIRGEVATGDRFESADAVRVVLDGQGPRFGPVAVTRAPDGAALLADVSLTDDFSEVKSLKAWFELRGDVISKEPVEGKRYGGGDKWRVKLPTEDLAPGEYTVAFVAEDGVGNPREDRARRVRVSAAKEQAATTAATTKQKKAKPVTNQVTGRIKRHPTRQIYKLKVKLVGPKTLTAQTDDDYSFRFPAVPPGVYQLEAKGLVANGRRTAKREVEVSDQPNQPKRLGTIELK